MKILIVDDDPYRVAVLMNRHSNHTTVHPGTLPDTLALLATDTFDLIYLLTGVSASPVVNRLCWLSSAGLQHKPRIVLFGTTTYDTARLLSAAGFQVSREEFKQ